MVMSIPISAVYSRTLVWLCANTGQLAGQQIQGSSASCAGSNDGSSVNLQSWRAGCGLCTKPPLTWSVAGVTLRPYPLAYCQPLLLPAFSLQASMEVKRELV